jgi:anti-sigma B factor antagonist
LVHVAATSLAGDATGALVIMSTFRTREESDVLVIMIDSAFGLNDFRNTGLREALYELVEERNEPRIAIDLVNVDYLSSSGVAILVGIKRRIDARNGKVVLFHLQPIVLDLLKVMRLDQYLNIVDDESAALASLRPIPSV